MIDKYNSFSKNTTIITELIQDYLKRKKFFSYDEITQYISSRIAKESININREGIKLILKALVEENYIRKGSKLTKDDIFKNLNRKQIYNFVEKNPGVYFYKIVKELKLKISVVAWHLNILEEFKLIKKEKLNGSEGYFDSKIKIVRALLLNLILREKSRKIIEIIANNNSGLTISKISRQLEMSRNTVKTYIEKLIDLNIIFFKKLGNEKIYNLNKPQLDFLIKTSIRRKKKYIQIPQFYFNFIKNDKSNFESKINFTQEDLICSVHKGSIMETIPYVCPICETLYCINCVRSLKEKENNCWNCENPFKINRI